MDGDHGVLFALDRLAHLYQLPGIVLYRAGRAEVSREELVIAALTIACWADRGSLGYTLPVSLR